jgi:D-arabinose 1-dehydrogenase-like Zn-dependent alcohol dehydrogenase
MKAAFIERFGGPEVLQYGDLPDPVASPGEIVIDIAATSVNAADWKVRLGEYQHTNFPLVPGRDFSGTVSAVGEGIKDIALGDTVFGVCEAGQEGTYAEKVAVKAGIVAKKPSGLSHVNAAALALTGLTAMSAIEDTLKLQRGETILIQGGAGGVAGFAIQLAKHIGARVITTASAANHAYVRGLGADEIVDYNVRDFTKAVANCDAVFDTVDRGDRVGLVDRNAAASTTSSRSKKCEMPGSTPPVSRQFLHQEPLALNLIQPELGRRLCYGRFRVRGLDLPEYLALAAKQDDTPPATHAAGELGGGVFAGAAAGRHADKIGMRAGRVDP